MSFEEALVLLAVAFLILYIPCVSFIRASNNAIKRDNSSRDVSQYGIFGGVYEWESQGLKGYIMGLDVDDGCAGYMELLTDEGDDISGVYVLVDLSCLTRVDDGPRWNEE